VRAVGPVRVYDVPIPTIPDGPTIARFAFAAPRYFRLLGLQHSPAEVLAVGNTRGYNSGMSKVMVSLPEDLLAEIDTEAKRRSTSRSALLASAARRELARRDPEQLTEAIARSVRRFDRAGTFEATDLVRDDRDSRH
jgi:hypothetical protein